MSDGILDELAESSDDAMTLLVVALASAVCERTGWSAFKFDDRRFREDFAYVDLVGLEVTYARLFVMRQADAYQVLVDIRSVNGHDVHFKCDACDPASVEGLLEQVGKIVLLGPKKEDET